MSIYTKLTNSFCVLWLVVGLFAGVGAPQSWAVVPAQSSARQDVAINAARNLMHSPLPGASDLAFSGNTENERNSSGLIYVWLTVGLAALALAVLYWLFKNRQTDVSVWSAPDSAHVRAALVRQDAVFDVDGVTARNPRFLELLVQQQLIAAEERESLSARFKGNDYAIMLFLAAQRPQIKSMIGKLWGDSIGVVYVNPAKIIIQHELLLKLPGNYAEQQCVLPFHALDNVVSVAMADPKNTVLQRQIESYLDALVSPVFALPDQIRTALEVVRVSRRTLTDTLKERLSSAAREGAAIGRMAEEKSVAEFVRGLFLLALKQHASDIHVEPHENNVLVRLRVDGALQEYLQLPVRLFPSLSNVLKIMAGMDIGERRRPQDGRITMKLPDSDIEFRVSCVPTIYGEKIVLRLLGQNQFVAVPGLEDLDFAWPILDGIRRIIASPNGVFFVTGPTGSGKTTTLYAALKHLNRKDLNIMTIEDPVEYRLPGINQVQVNPQAGVTFATALRAFLRQDPDVMLVGEIRDLETARIASQAALTGHLVLTTLHTNNAMQAVTRLIQIGVEPFLVAPSIIGVMAQRLVRRLCEHCKKKYALTSAQIAEYFLWDGHTEVFFHRAKGCEKCNYTGYAGRIAIHELFIIDDEMRTYIARNASILDIYKYAHSVGFNPMRYDGFKKILRGLTTVEEVQKVTVASD